MYWEEKIDRLKKEVAPDWWTILKKIEDKFVIKENSNYSFSNWDGRLKGERANKKNLDSQY